MPEADRELGRLLAEHEVPGAVLGSLDDGETTIVASGVADVTTGERVTADTRFAVGSLAKSMLARPGRSMRRSATCSATVRVPLTDALESGEFPGEDEGVLSRFAAAVAAESPTAAFWSYTNAGWCLLGRALESVTGLPFEHAPERQAISPATPACVRVARPRVDSRRGP